MERWEYRFERLAGMNYEKRFNELGEEGWEAIAVTSDKIVIFKRRVH